MLNIKLLDIIALILVTSLTMFSFNLAQNNNKVSDYNLGYVNGRMEEFMVDSAITSFHSCLKYTNKTPSECWKANIDSANKALINWDKLSDAEKVNYYSDIESSRWINNIRNKNYEDMPRFIR